TSVTGAKDFVMDVNGGKGPNSEKINGKWHDIRSFNTAQFSKGCAGKKFDGIGCVVVTDTSYDWEGAKKACSDMDMTLADNNTIINVCFQSPLGDKYKGGYFWSIEEDPYASNKAFRLGGSGGCSGTTSYKSNFSYYPAMCVSE
ncbi:hypothetical protein J6P92_07155, partial [bacterium]|nr:hypothetical protein [bacterium]